MKTVVRCPLCNSLVWEELDEDGTPTYFPQEDTEGYEEGAVKYD